MLILKLEFKAKSWVWVSIQGYFTVCQFSKELFVVSLWDSCTWSQFIKALLQQYCKQQVPEWCTRAQSMSLMSLPSTICYPHVSQSKMNIFTWSLDGKPFLWSVIRWRNLSLLRPYVTSSTAAPSVVGVRATLTVASFCSVAIFAPWGMVGEGGEYNI